MNTQEIIKLNYDDPNEFEWSGGENDYYSEDWATQVVTNVSEPTMIVYRPQDEINTGVSIIIGPGGGLYAHSINTEGKWVAEWLVQKGITVFVLKYRLVPYDGDAVKAFGDPQENAVAKAKSFLPFSTADGLVAVSYVRENAAKFNIDTDKIGFMGFSAGAAVALDVTFTADKNQMPDFIVPVYPWLTIISDYKIPENAPPMLVVCASDDPLGLAVMSVDLYEKWLSSGISSAIHIYSKGGHGFGMRTQNLASDNWIDRCYEWMIDEMIIIDK